MDKNMYHIPFQDPETGGDNDEEQQKSKGKVVKFGWIEGVYVSANKWNFCSKTHYFHNVQFRYSFLNFNSLS